MDERTRGPVHLTWDPHLRLATITFDPGARADGDDARFFVGALADWVGTDAEPFGIMGQGLTAETAEWRSLLLAFIRQHRDHLRVAVTHMSPVIRIIVEMFASTGGLPIKVFPTAEQARAWLLSPREH